MQEYTGMKDPSKIKTTWLLPRDLVKQAKQYALDHDTNVTALVSEALKDFLKKKTNKL
jgi:post-segregation antitoxin (ccd killing protein)